MNPRRVYVASSWKNAVEVRRIAHEIRSAGHQVFDFTDAKRPDGFDKFVFDASELIGPRAEIDWKEFLGREPAKRAFCSDMAGLDWSDTVVLLNPSGRSAHLEAGYAVGKGKRLFIIGDLPRGEFDVMYGMAKRCYRSRDLDLLVEDLETAFSQAGFEERPSTGVDQCLL